MNQPWYLSCPHACYDPDTCPYGRNHLPKIEALLRQVERLKAQLVDTRGTIPPLEDRS